MTLHSLARNRRTIKYIVCQVNRNFSNQENLGALFVILEYRRDGHDFMLFLGVH
jgi:hypothetical protein